MDFGEKVHAGYLGLAAGFGVMSKAAVDWLRQRSADRRDDFTLLHQQLILTIQALQGRVDALQRAYDAERDKHANALDELRRARDSEREECRKENEELRRQVGQLKIEVADLRRQLGLENDHEARTQVRAPQPPDPAAGGLL